MDIIIQGNTYEYTPGVVGHFENCDFVDKVIVSTWEDDPFDHNSGKVITIKGPDVSNPGIGNRNRQIISTQRGLELVTSEVCAKFRTDQIFPSTTLLQMQEFYQANQDNRKIFVLGLYRNWPFHPRDHMFWGPTDRMKMLFDIPLDSSDGETPSADIDSSCNILRSEAWIGCNYAAKYDDRMVKYLQEPTTYLVDDAPKLDEAFEVHNEWYEKLFYPFPRIQYSWPKVGIDSYYYDYTCQFSEYWHEEIMTNTQSHQHSPDN